jgi:hypothetical protein
MPHDDQNTALNRAVDTGTGNKTTDATATAFAAALKAGFATSAAMRAWFQQAATEAAERDSLLAYLLYLALVNDEQEEAISRRYPRAVLDWNQLEKRARAHGIVFSVTAQAHHRAAVLDYLDHPNAATLIAHKHLTWFAPIRTQDLKQNAENWRRYQQLCTPLRNRDVSHDRAVRSALTGLRHIPSEHAARTVAARPRAQP